MQNNHISVDYGKIHRIAERIRKTFGFKSVFINPIGEDKFILDVTHDGIFSKITAFKNKTDDTYDLDYSALETYVRRLLLFNEWEGTYFLASQSKIIDTMLQEHDLDKCGYARIVNILYRVSNGELNEIVNLEDVIDINSILTNGKGLDCIRLVTDDDIITLLRDNVIKKHNYFRDVKKG